MATKCENNAKSKTVRGADQWLRSDVVVVVPREGGVSGGEKDSALNSVRNNESNITLSFLRDPFPLVRGTQRIGGHVPLYSNFVHTIAFI